MIFTRES